QGKRKCDLRSKPQNSVRWHCPPWPDQGIWWLPIVPNAIYQVLSSSGFHFVFFLYHAEVTPQPHHRHNEQHRHRYGTAQAPDAPCMEDKSLNGGQVAGKQYAEQRQSEDNCFAAFCQEWYSYLKQQHREDQQIPAQAQVRYWNRPQLGVDGMLNQA